MRKTFLSFFFNQQTGKVFFQIIVSDAVRHVILCPLPLSHHKVHEEYHSITFPEYTLNIPEYSFLPYKQVSHRMIQAVLTASNVSFSSIVF